MCRQAHAVSSKVVTYSKGTFLCGDPNQWSKTTWTWCMKGTGESFVGSSVALWYKWSWITDPDLANSKGKHPKWLILSTPVTPFIMRPYVLLRIVGKSEYCKQEKFSIYTCEIFQKMIMQKCFLLHWSCLTQKTTPFLFSKIAIHSMLQQLLTMITLDSSLAVLTILHFTLTTLTLQLTMK